MRNIDGFFAVSLKKLFNSQLICWWFETPCRSRDVGLWNDIQFEFLFLGWHPVAAHHIALADILIWYTASMAVHAIHAALLTRPSVKINFNTLRLPQNGCHFADDRFKCIFLNKNVWILIKISLNFVLKDQINNIPALVQIMAWRRLGDKPLSESMKV